MTMMLVDDGTMDTVFECDKCGQRVRYSNEATAPYRDADGDMSDLGYECAEEDHADECQVQEEMSELTKACADGEVVFDYEEHMIQTGRTIRGKVVA